MSQKNKKLIHKSFFMVTLTCVGLFIIGLSVVFGFISNREMRNEIEVDTIYNNIFINDIDVGGLTKQEVLKKLQEAFFEKARQKLIIINADEDKLEFTIAELNPKFDFTEAVEEAYSFARTGSIRARYNMIKQLITEPKKFLFTPELTYDDTILVEKIEEFSEHVNVIPVNATLVRENGKFLFIDEVNGKELDVSETIKLVKKYIDNNESGEVNAVFNIMQPKYSAENLINSTSLLGSYSSTITKPQSNDGRMQNLITGSFKINGKVLYPDEIFSTNKAFGTMSLENGYAMAPIIVSGRFEDGIGGGICQVSTALYNAVMWAELTVVERQNHSLKVGYADYGFDATLAGDYIDFKFKNNTDYPIYIESYIEGNQLIVNIYGNETRSPNRVVSFEKALVETILPDVERVIEDDTMFTGERVVTSQPRTGYRYNVYKIVYEDGVQVEKLLYNSSYYKAVRGEVRVGTKKIIKPEVEMPTEELVNMEEKVIEELFEQILVETLIEQERDAYLIEESNS